MYVPSPFLEELRTLMSDISKQSFGGERWPQNMMLVGSAVERILALESSLKDALDYIDNPNDTLGPTLIVHAGRQLLNTR